jgi:hypothetical protein
MHEDQPKEPGLWSDDAVDGLLRAASQKATRAPRRQHRALVASLGVASSVACCLLVLRAAEPSVTYEVGAVLGGLSDLRSAAHTSQLRAGADSLLSIRLRPSRARTALPCEVFTRCGRHVRHVPARVVPAGQGGLLVEGSARSWFGESPGACSVWLGLGDVAGVTEPPTSPSFESQVQWLTVQVQYLGDLGPGHE